MLCFRAAPFRSRRRHPGCLANDAALTLFAAPHSTPIFCRAAPPHLKYIGAALQFGAVPAALLPHLQCGKCCIRYSAQQLISEEITGAMFISTPAPAASGWRLLARG